MRLNNTFSKLVEMKVSLNPDSTLNISNNQTSQNNQNNQPISTPTISAPRPPQFKTTRITPISSPKQETQHSQHSLTPQIPPTLKSIIIQLQNFKKYQSFEIKIPLNKTTLLKGESGAGKTTIVQAISWTLFGKIQPVKPNQGDSTKTARKNIKSGTVVTILFPYQNNSIIEIRRSKDPNRLLLYHYPYQSGTKYDFTKFGSDSQYRFFEDDQAQAYINTIFGHKDIFNATCYLEQGERNIFFSSTNNEKMSILNSLAFQEEDPEKFLISIDERIKEASDQQTISKVEYETTLSIHNSTDFKGDIQDILSPNTANNYKQQLPIIAQEIQSLSQQQQLRQYNLNLQSRLLQDKNNITPIPTDQEIQLISDTIPILRERESLLSQIKFIQKPNIIYTQQEYQQALEQNTLYNTYSQQVLRYNISYSQNDINLYISNIKQMLQQQSTLSRYYEYKNLQDKLDQLNYNINILKSKSYEYKPVNNISEPDYSNFDTSKIYSNIQSLNDEINQFKNKKQQLLSRQNILKCPCCGNSLKLDNNNQLVKSEFSPSNYPEIQEVDANIQSLNSKIRNHNNDISTLNNQRSQAERSYQNQLRQNNDIIMYNNSIDLTKKQDHDQISALEANISTITSTMKLFDQQEFLSLDITQRLLQQQELSYLQDSIRVLSEIPIIEKPKTDPYVIQQAIIEEQNYNNNELLKLKLNQLSVPENYKLNLYESTSRLNLLQRNKTSLDLINKQFSEIYIPTDNSDRIQDLINTESNLKSLLLKHEHGLTFQRSKQNLDSKLEILTSCTNRLASLQKFKQKAIEVECATLELIVNNINRELSEISERIFDDPIDIKVQLFKQIKTKKYVKPTVNFDIKYNNGIYDNIKHISGGEGDRVSIALTMAFQKMAGYPLLLIDESLAQVGLDLKERAVCEMGRMGTCLVVMHDGVEGIFDNVIEI